MPRSAPLGPCLPALLLLLSLLAPSLAFLPPPAPSHACRQASSPLPSSAAPSDDLSKTIDLLMGRATLNILTEPTPYTPPPRDFSKLTVVQLKKMLRERGMAVAGKKADLVSRLDELVAHPPLLAAAPSHAPAWLFRQAGRHLPEYAAYKSTFTPPADFLSLLSAPERVAECTVMPLRRYPLDAAIVFSDILVVPAALGLKLEMPGGVGIRMEKASSPEATPEQAREDVDKVLAVLEQYPSPRSFVLSALSLPLSSLRCTRDLMAAENHPAPLLGFAAAPYTLLHYMVGGTTKNAGAGGAFCRAHPAQATRLLDALRGVVVEFLSLQLGAGADALQLFEAVAYTLTEEEHGRWAAPWMEGVAREVKARHGDKKLFGFQRGMPSGAGGMVAAGFDAVTSDGSMPRAEFRALAGSAAVQGDFDPALLIKGNGNTKKTVRAAVKAMLAEFGPGPIIANLREGLGGKEDVELVREFVDAVHEESREMWAKAKGE